jgi:hypothetical protein
MIQWAWNYRPWNRGARLITEAGPAAAKTIDGPVEIGTPQSLSGRC